MPDFAKWLERATKIRLKGGVVSLVARVLICAVLAIAFIAWTLTPALWAVGLTFGVLVVALCFPILWRLMDFAEKNPQAALLEGAQWIQHEKMLLGTKANPELPADPSATQPPSPLLEGGTVSSDVKPNETQNG